MSAVSCGSGVPGVEGGTDASSSPSSPSPSPPVCEFTAEPALEADREPPFACSSRVTASDPSSASGDVEVVGFDSMEGSGVGSQDTGGVGTTSSRERVFPHATALDNPTKTAGLGRPV